MVSCVSAGCPYPLVLGHASGRVVCVRVREAGGSVRAQCRPLHAHRAPVHALHAAPRAGLLVSASLDGHIVLWDLHKYHTHLFLPYIHTTTRILHTNTVLLYVTTD